MKNDWKEEFYKVFEINQGSGRINGYITKNVGEDYSRPATVEDFEMYFEDLLEEQKKELMEYIQKEVQERMMKYDSKDGYSNLHDEIMEKVYDDVTDIFKHHD